MTNPVAPVVTDEMLNAAEDAYDKVAYYEGRHFCYRGPLRAAITAALEASGELEELKAGVNQLERQLDANQDAFFAQEAELERLRAALTKIENMEYINQLSGQMNFERAPKIARTALEGGTV